MTTTMEHLLKGHLCEFTSEGDGCETPGCGIIPDGQPVYFFSDGGYDSREGTYRCMKCAREMLEETAEAVDAMSAGMREAQGYPPLST